MTRKSFLLTMTLAYEQWKWRRRPVTCLPSSWNMTNVLCGWTGRIQEDLGQAFVFWAKKQKNFGTDNEQMRGKETLNNACELGEKGDILCTCLGLRRKRTLDLLSKKIWTLDLLFENTDYWRFLKEESGLVDGHSKIRTLWRYKHTCKLIPVQQFTLKITKYWWMQLDPGIWETKFLQANQKCQCSQSGRTRTKISVQKEKNNQMCNF